MFDILLFLFESYFDIGKYPDHEKLSVKLSAAGFEEDDISQTLSWLSGLKQLNETKYPDSINRNALRVYTDFEHERLGTEGLQFLMFWEHSKFISPVEREMIIDRVVALNRKNLPFDKVKLIVLMVLWSQHEQLDPLLIEDLLIPSDILLTH